ncbi:hypothetical protein [Deinococcus aestuarii]|uniref:hypothetical protein n=1 Tax=Deinococcus aestuarii TaxID=2774531 RepID=UPI001C0AA490|nr:hypothetical protein [Deinococcus aestuarii]
MTLDVAREARGQRHDAFVYICTCGHHLTVFASSAPSARQSDQLAQRRGWKLDGETWTCAECSAE